MDGVHSFPYSSILAIRWEENKETKTSIPVATQIFPMTEEPRITPHLTPEDHHPNPKVTYSIRIMDEVQTYNELLKLLENK